MQKFIRSVTTVMNFSSLTDHLEAVCQAAGEALERHPHVLDVAVAVAAAALGDGLAHPQTVHVDDDDLVVAGGHADLLHLQSLLLGDVTSLADGSRHSMNPLRRGSFMSSSIRYSIAPTLSVPEQSLPLTIRMPNSSLSALVKA